MAITPPSNRIWWREPIAKIELIWIVIGFIWGLVMFFMMIYWHAVGDQNMSNEAYRITPAEFVKRTEAMVAKYKVREVGDTGVPVVKPPPGSEVARDSMIGADWPEDLDRIVYVDRFGNAMTGLRAAVLAPGAVLEAGGRSLARADSFFQVPVGAAFWYENANGLAEIAVNQGRADQALGLSVGAAVRIGTGSMSED